MISSEAGSGNASFFAYQAGSVWPCGLISGSPATSA